MSSSNMMRRIHADLREVRAAKSVLYTALPLEDDMRQWYFTIRGAPDTEFEGGIYHGRIILPAEYPFKPPNIMLLTPNGRFEVRQKICLSLSAHHPESWQPAWGIRTILEALISFLPTPPEGAVGSLDWSKKERKRAARISRKSPEKSKYIPKVYQDHVRFFYDEFLHLFFFVQNFVPKHFSFLESNVVDEFKIFKTLFHNTCKNVARNDSYLENSGYSGGSEASPT